MVLGWKWEMLGSVGDLWSWITVSKRFETKAAELDSQTEIASLKLGQILDDLGYSEKDINQRIFCSFKSSVARTLSERIIQNCDDIDRIFIGSRREGIGQEFINDLDILKIYKFVKCVEIQQLEYNPSDIVFIVDKKSAPPGHIFLWLQQKGNDENKFRFLEHALVQRKGRQYLSAHKFMSQNDDMFLTSEGFIGKSTKYLGKKGPSLVKISNTRNGLQNLLLDLLQVKDQTMDYVRAFPCDAKQYVSHWQHRQRKHNWPPTHLVNSIASMTAAVVPTGQKETKMQELQWRICFPAGELTLFNSLSFTQKKMYVVLKTVGKQLLQPIDLQITSYVMKNVLFWECTSTHQFRHDDNTKDVDRRLRR
ncbi:uncharacterized protein LOC127872088 [Dreissena polymorpha]|uniref:uncharacterized protein LOC127872088 n=1 Tax=Dreissena polymorpha TaxID=45954 RepID=UPI002264B93E|nr:uncharacterized protein LOC127872088 [Dreissena polymorpha]